MTCALMASAITDQEVISYIKTAMAAGKSEQQIGRELLAKGVTPEQAERIKAQVEGQNLSETAPVNQSVRAADNERRHDVTDDIALESVDIVQTELETGLSGQPGARRVYGHRVFNSRALTFEPSDNLATPQNYRLGPGDEVIIDIWGASEDHLRQTISPEGSIMISQIGPVYLN